jgi:excisionase family DNA binding protein
VEGPDQVQWLTVDEVAQMLRVTDETVRRWIRRGELPALNVGGARPDYRLQRGELEQFIRRRYGQQSKAAA